MKVAIVKT